LNNNLFDRPLSHTNDPETSYNAADRMLKSGALNRQEQKVCSAIVEFIGFQPNTFGFTAKELPRYSGISYFVIQRRLSGLRNKGRIERISINNNGKPPWKKRDGCCVYEVVKGDSNDGKRKNDANQRGK